MLCSVQCPSGGGRSGGKASRAARECVSVEARACSYAPFARVVDEHVSEPDLAGPEATLDQGYGTAVVARAVARHHWAGGTRHHGR